MKIAPLIAAAALLAAWPAAAQEAGPTQAVRLCENLTLYAGSQEAGEWRDIRLEDARTAQAVTYTANSARVGEVRGAPALLLQNGRAQVSGVPQAVTFDELMLSSCPEASLRLAF